MKLETRDVVYLGLGSNMGNREDFLAVTKKELEKFLQIVKESSIYETEPLGDSDKWFLNQVIEVRTDLRPEELLKKIKLVEKKVGRKKRARWGDREIDVDILFFGDIVIWRPELVIPHSGSTHRKFILLPLIELNPDFIHPVLHLPIKKLLNYGSDKLIVRPWIPKKLKN
jgi:2-amino-4-hydroxy-6-hydroxymethyldihydropteridine diphosphokinase